MIKERYKEKYGSVEPYLALKLEIMIIVSLIISIVGTIFNFYLHFLQVFTLGVIALTLYQVKKKYPEEILKYSLVFISLYIAAVFVPMILTGFAVPITPSGINTLLVILIGVLVLFMGLKVVTNKKGVKAEVLLSDEDIAVIRPEYDLISGIKPNRYVVDNKGASKGDKVLVNLSKTPFKKPRPKEIVEVIK